MGSAIGHSLDVYYRDAARTARMDRLNACFVRPGDLVFDVGAHVGDRTASFRRLGAKVITLEPQPHVFRALRLIHGRDAQVTLRPEAVGDAMGEIALHLNTSNPTVSTASAELIEAADDTREWAGQVWDRTIRVPVVTLDHLIATHGTPAFIKIDVEGHEAAVLAGLSTPVKALSFEVTTIQRAVAFACLSRLTELGAYEFNLSLGEEHALRHTDWISAEAMTTVIAQLPNAANSGDVYGRLPDGVCGK
ncbi:FkbM family methyltransferase [Gymnodinialimonas sp. 57CJ19]|uniref:FkbM family methyltransferase n=1 Tax=Gymnodinialimonas sp. 57CJ19 TaxID=3138498 RepID=UPI00313457A7